MALEVLLEIRTTSGKPSSIVRVATEGSEVVTWVTGFSCQTVREKKKRRAAALVRRI